MGVNLNEDRWPAHLRGQEAPQEHLVFKFIFAEFNMRLISEEEMSKQSDIFLILCHFYDNL